jgi:hypothetical protein
MMQFFTKPGYIVYGLSTLLAFVTGCMPFLLLLIAAAFVGASDKWNRLFLVALGAWVLCFLIPLIFLASRTKVPAWLAIIGSFAIVVYCAYALVTIRPGNANPVLVAGLSIPISLWLAIPFLFNAFHIVISLFRYQQIRHN